MMPVDYIKRAARLLFLLVASLLVGGALSSCSDGTQPHFKIAGSTMGTRYHITVLSKPGVEASEADLRQAIEQQLVLINQQMSTYDENSELSTLNNTPTDSWLEVSANLFDVLMLSLELGWLSNGAFDITVGPLVDLWGFGPGGTARPDRVPSAEEIARLQARTGFQHIEFNLQNNGILKRQPVTIDLSAIAKGFAVDKVAELLQFAGYTDFMVEIGGELRLQGNAPSGNSWRIAIEQPDTASMGQVHQAVNVSGVGMATSGDYRNYFDREGRRYSHTIDPVSGYPVQHQLASVTVIAETAAYADGLATAINVLGPEKGWLLAQKQALAVYMITRSAEGFEARYSEAFRPYLDTP